ncbi:MAG: hypothetical protein B6I24_04210 [Bacteroidetes bacterium 4572_128]|nr:MAG: hypothetical protein B6I24_04210 [Bacteroidetes bacterium 4572_128]
MFSEFVNCKVSNSPLKLENVKILKGANYYSVNKVIRLKINLLEYDEVFTNEINGFYEKIKNKIPSLYNHHCSVGKIGGLFQRIKNGTLLGHVIEHTALELQNLSGLKSDMGKTRMTKIQGIYNVIFEYEDEIAGIYAGKSAFNLISAILKNEDFNMEKIIKNLIFIREKRLMGPSTKAIVEEAMRRKIPVIRLDKYNMVQLGTGKYKKIIRATTTDETSLIAVEIIDNKFRTGEVLKENGVPFPDGIITDNLEDIISFFEKGKSPIVLKPYNGYQGKRCSLELNDKENIKKAFFWAKEFDESVISQKYIEGKLYRMLFIDFKFVAAVRLIPPYIVGDGKNNIDNLIKILNNEKDREFGDKGKLSKLEIDEDTLKILELKSYNLESILPEKEIIYLKNSGNMRLGGMSIDVTNKVHDFNKFMGERISKILNLNVAGIDLLSKDISQKVTQNDAKFIEVNAAPDFRMHFNATKGIKRNVQRQFVSMMFKGNQESRIPIISITGSKGKCLTSEIIDYGFRKQGFKNGVLSRKGIFIENYCLKKGDKTEAKNVEIILKDPIIDLAIIETPIETILNSGLGYSFSDIAIILNIYDLKKEYYNYDHVKYPEDVMYAKSVLVEKVYKDGYTILNADDKFLSDILEIVYSELILFSKNDKNSEIKKHIKKGGIAVFVENNNIVLVENHKKQIIISTEKLSIFKENEEDFVLESLLSSIACFFVFEIPVLEIKNILKTKTNEIEK